ncbi:Metallo-dependent phosphatase-like protein [Fimicolochytrium jonesii]|uniref:Metallo-dependent phosphatase-like protein n=1 Tax=Fimicolochytrium jonesii TaxID=1396493 RepID=UPI0022FEB4FD|nr:Metallo-dependent phosphatase-like protein [Fimicolochytrium jonesii]KAI8824929.1 Metallo-dependent phosphatase-like protein [Fimicolochytrium jonesii]
MKLSLALISLALAATSYAAPVTKKCGGGQKPPHHGKKNNMTILATNDIHAHFDEFNLGGTDCRPKDIAANNCVGGAARIAHLVQKYRAERDNVVLLDAGDQFQGTLFFNVFGGQKSVEIMNELKYDAMAIGNHEFDKGVEYAAQFFKNLTFPVVSSNIDFKKGDGHILKEAGVKPYTILRDYGVGVIGYITNTTASIATGARNTSFYNPVPIVQRYIDELHRKGYRRVIAVSHNGYADDKYLAENTRGLSLIVGGHSHSLLLNNASLPGVVGPYPTSVTNLDGKPTYIIQHHRYGDYLGHVDLEWDANTDELLNLSGEAIRLDAAIPKDNATAIKVAQWREAFKPMTERIVGQADGPFPVEGCGVRECALGDLVADSMLFSAPSADIAFTNAGGLRAAIPSGPVTYADVITVLPFGNTINIFSYTGAQVLALLDRTADLTGADGKKMLSTPQWGGVHFTYDVSKPAGSRITTATLLKDGSAIDPAKTYVIATNDFILGGGDNIISPVAGPAGEVMADALATYLGTKPSFKAEIQGRWGPVANTTATH